MVSFHRERIKAIRQGVSPDKIKKCKTNLDIQKLVLQLIKKKTENNDNQKENSED